MFYVHCYAYRSNDSGLLERTREARDSTTPQGIWSAFKQHFFAIFRPASPPAEPANDDSRQTLCHRSPSSPPLHWHHLILYALLTVADVEGNCLCATALLCS